MTKPHAGERRVTLADIGKAVGVDASTVSLVLNDKPLAQRIKADTKAQIFAAAKQLGYTPSASARALRTGKSGLIGMVVGNIASGFYSAMTAAALKAAEAHGMQLLIVATEWDSLKERKALETLMAQRVDGILCLPASLAAHRDLHRRLLQTQVPVVTNDCRLEGSACVSSDYSSGMFEALADISTRHKTIHYISSRADLSAKATALKSAAQRWGMEIHALEYEGTGLDRFDFDVRQLYEIAESPRACLVNCDEGAIMLIDQLLRDGRNVSKEFEIIGIDGLRWSQFYHPRFATIKQDCDALMQNALDLLTAEPFVPRVVEVPTHYLPA